MWKRGCTLPHAHENTKPARYHLHVEHHNLAPHRKYRASSTHHEYHRRLAGASAHRNPHHRGQCDFSRRHSQPETRATCNGHHIDIASPLARPLSAPRRNNSQPQPHEADILKNCPPVPRQRYPRSLPSALLQRALRQRRPLCKI